MIPISLKFRGLYSYQKEVFIDFKKLSSSGIFGIFGDVGSGKSTILEAMTLALFGESERLNLRDNRQYNLMNLKSDKIHIDFIFQSGDELYRCISSTNRNRNNYNEVRSFDSKIYQATVPNPKETDWLPLENKKRQVIDLTYSNFKKTVIIPQGRFQEFVQLSPTERANMLKEVFDLKRFDLFDKVKALESKNEANINLTKGSLQPLESINQESIENNKKLISEIIVKISTSIKKIESLTQSLEELEKLQTLFASHKEAKLKYEQLLLKQGEIHKIENEIFHFEKCSIQFKHLIFSLRELEADIHKNQKDLEVKEKDYKSNNEAIQIEKKNLLVLETENKKIPEYESKLKELSKLLELKKLKTNIYSLNKDLGIANNNLTSQKKLIESKKSQINSITEMLVVEKESYQKSLVLNEIQIWSNKIGYREKQRDKELLEIQAIEKDISDNLLQWVEKVRSTIEILELSNEINLDDTKDVLKIISEAIETLKQQEEKLNSDQASYVNQQPLASFSAMIVPGQECPLCGSIEHPKPYSSIEVKQHIEEITKNKNIVSEKIRVTFKSLNELEKIDYNIEQKRKNLNEKKKQLQNTLKEIEEIDKEYNWDYPKDKLNVLPKELEKLKKINQSIEQKEKSKSSLEKEIESATKHLEEIQSKKNSISELLAGLTAQELEIVSSFQFIKQEEIDLLEEDKISKERISLIDKIKKINLDYNQKTLQLKELEKDTNQMIGKIQSLQKSLLEGKEKHSVLTKEIQNKLDESNYSSILEVENILNKKLNIELQKSIVNKYKEELAISKNKWNQLETEIQGKIFDLKILLSTKEELENQKAELEEIKTQKVKLETENNDRIKQLEQKLKLIKELKKLEERQKDISELKSLFTKQGFVDYVSSLYLKDICNSANERFYILSGKKLKMEIQEDNQFMIRDFLNEGRLRNIKTLSGGQTFQAALTLALALSDRIRNFTKDTQNFFFIDEGFGSLDKDSLEVVFETLKSLRKENRIVGIISHVEEMKNEIQNFIKVENTKEEGSIITNSWE